MNAALLGLKKNGTIKLIVRFKRFLSFNLNCFAVRELVCKTKYDNWHLVMVSCLAHQAHY